MEHRSVGPTGYITLRFDQVDTEQLLIGPAGCGTVLKLTSRIQKSIL